MILRPYQQECIDAIITAIKANDDCFYIKAATGSGKTFMIVRLIEELQKYKPELRAFFVVPKNILIQQTVDSFPVPGDIGVYNAGLNRKELDKNITVASIQSLVRAPYLPECNILIYDECHRFSKNHKTLHDKLKAIRPQMKTIGLTATDYSIGDKFWKSKVFDVSLKELTDQGYLCKIVTEESKVKLDLTGVKIVAGDYVVSDLEKKLTPDKVQQQVADLIKRTVNRKNVIILSTSIKHAEDIYAELWNESASIIHSKMPSNERAVNTEQFKTSTKYLVSVLIASEGYDHPAADCLAFMRPTRSPTLYEQGVGRIARLHADKEDGLFLDYGNIIENLGFIYDIRASKKGEIRHKICVECELANPPKALECERCHEPFTYMCSECLSMVRFGEGCCVKKRKKIDPLKNTTETAYVKPSPWKNVTHFTVKQYTSKAGNWSLRVDYYNGIFNKLASEYFQRWGGDNFARWVSAHTYIKGFISPEDFLKLDDVIYRTPSEILLVTNGKYKNVKSRRFL